MRISKLRVVVLTAMAVFLAAVAYSGQANPKQYAIARSVKVCALLKDGAMKCGTGTFVSPNQIMTAFHVVSPEKVPTKIYEGIPLEFEVSTPTIAVLRQDSVDFEPAVLIASFSAIDTAVLFVSGSSRYAKLNLNYYRGERVIAIGNSFGRDFGAIDTTITGTSLLKNNDGEGMRRMITVEAMENKITHGFSGGGVFANGRLIGMTQVCSDGFSICGLIPMREIMQYIKTGKH